MVSVMFLMVERRCNNLRREVNKSTVGAPVNDGVIVRLNSLTSHRTKHTLKPKHKLLKKKKSSIGTGRAILSSHALAL